MEKVVQTWVESVGRRLGNGADEVDRRRLAAGFEALIDSVTGWPAPAMLFAVMPSRGQVLGPDTREAPRQLEAPMAVEEQQERLQALIASVSTEKGINPGVIPNERARHLQVVRDKAL